MTAPDQPGDPRCVRCEFLIRSYEPVYNGHCAVCAGRSAFVVSAAASKALREEYEAWVDRAASKVEAA